MSVTTWRFEALDTWFFRESRPHGALGGSELGSLFPPPARTVAGAVRFLMGESLGVSWRAFGRGDGRVGGLDLIAEIGRGDDLGKLRLGGPWLARKTGPEDSERLYPAPGFLLGRSQPERGEDRFLRLNIGPVGKCDLGRVPLPQVDGARAKALERVWLTGEGLSQVLAGASPDAGEVVDLRTVYGEEPRLGIARDNRRRTNLEGLLYQTRHVRPVEELCVEVDVAGVDERLLAPPSLVRFGGEGRMAAVGALPSRAKLPAAPEPNAETRGLILCLLTAADLNGAGEGWLPPGFDQQDRPSATVWRGEINGVQLILRSAVIGKALREGGWDLALGMPRAVKSLLPAGSAWYCTVENRSLSNAISRLHGQSIGAETPLGRGRLAVALWNQSEY